MRQRLWCVLMLLFGAVLLGTAGLAAGSWYGGRGAAPYSPGLGPSVAAKLLPGVAAVSMVDARGYRYGGLLVAGDFGTGFTEIRYDKSPDCALSDQLRRNAVALGWRDLRRTPGAPCDGWRAERDGLAITLTHRPHWSSLTIRPAAPDGFRTATLIGTLLGIAAGAALFWLLARRRLPAPRLIGALVTVALLPGAVLTWARLAADGLAEPVWPIWRALALLLAPLLFVLLLVGLIVIARRSRPTAADASTAGQS